MSKRDDLRAAAAAMGKTAREVRPVPAWPGAFVRTITAGDTDRVNLKTLGQDRNGITQMAMLYLCDENGERLFDLTDPDDVATVDAMPHPVIRQVTEIGSDLNGSSAAGQAEAGNV